MRPTPPSTQEPRSACPLDVDEADLFRVDASIRSVSVVRKVPVTRLVGKETVGGGIGIGTDSFPHLTTELASEETFAVSNILDGTWYLVTRRTSVYQLIFPLKEGYIMIEVTPEVDVVDVADKIIRQLSAPKANMVGR